MPKQLKPGQFIVKVQRPLVSNDPSMTRMALIYNQDRSVETFLPLTSQLDRAMGDGPKRYFYAHMEGTVLHLDKPAPWQWW